MLKKPRKPVTGTASLLLRIQTVNSKGKEVRTEYLCRRLDPEPSIGYPAWRLTKMKDGCPSEDVYDVILTPHGYSCSCPDFIFAREHQDSGGCKHIKSVRGTRLFERG